jgi:hypothetical protein
MVVSTKKKTGDKIMAYTSMDGSETWGVDDNRLERLKKTINRTKRVYKVFGEYLEEYKFDKESQISDFLEKVNVFQYYQDDLVFKTSFGEIFRTNKTGYKNNVVVVNKQP